MDRLFSILFFLAPFAFLGQFQLIDASSVSVRQFRSSRLQVQDHLHVETVQGFRSGFCTLINDSSK